MEKKYTSCNFLYPDVINASVPYNSLFVRIKKRIVSYGKSACSRYKNNFYPKKRSKEVESLNLQPGEWVEVRSMDEISQTLDEKRKYKGLFFMWEMEKCCGKKFKVFKKVEIIKLEPTGDIRKLKSPTVFLEGAYCNGELQEGCDRSCFHFWKEAWLKRLPDKQQEIPVPIHHSISNPEKSARGATSEIISPLPENDRLNLQPGDWVQVKSVDEIFPTLDDEGKYKGLYFMPEMEKFCGKKFKVFKRADIVKLESTMEVRKLTSPTIFLENVYCNGELHDGCDRSCFHFWREVWLNRIPDK